MVRATSVVAALRVGEQTRHCGSLRQVSRTETRAREPAWCPLRHSRCPAPTARDRPVIVGIVPLADLVRRQLQVMSTAARNLRPSHHTSGSPTSSQLNRPSPDAEFSASGDRFLDRALGGGPE